jgi:hypothetical protein
VKSNRGAASGCGSPFVKAGAQGGTLPRHEVGVGGGFANASCDAEPTGGGRRADKQAQGVSSREEGKGPGGCLALGRPEKEGGRGGKGRRVSRPAGGSGPVGRKSKKGGRGKGIPFIFLNEISKLLFKRFLNPFYV